MDSILFIYSRLSTIRTADKIVAIKDGVVQEIGTHDDLMLNEGLYHTLVMAQLNNDEEQAERYEEDDVIEDLELIEHNLTSLTSLNNHPSRPKQIKRSAKNKIERKISLSSIVSDDSFSMDNLEDASQAIMVMN